MKKKRLHGFTLIELMVAIALLLIMMSIVAFGYKRYESRYRCKAAAQILCFDLRLQMQRARSLDQPVGIFFPNPKEYYLGTHPITGPVSISSFVPNSHPRRVDFTQQYAGVSIESVGGNSSFPIYIYFDPSSTDASNNWIPLSGFDGTIVLKGDISKLNIIVKPNKELSVETQ